MFTWNDGSFIALDIEATGFGSASRIVEFAAVYSEAGRIIEGFDTLVNPGIPIPESASLVHGIYDEHVAGAPLWSDVKPEIERFLSRDVPWVAHNATYDVARLVDHGVTRSPWVFCSLRYAQREHPVLRHRRRGHKLSDLAEYFNIEFSSDRAHTARGDAEVLQHIVCKMLQGVTIASCVPGYML